LFSQAVVPVRVSMALLCLKDEKMVREPKNISQKGKRRGETELKWMEPGECPNWPPEM
jgi:hypothetical protein